MTPRVEIDYCVQGRWLLRAACMAQELPITFEGEIGEVALVPGKGGVGSDSDATELKPDRA